MMILAWIFFVVLLIIFTTNGAWHSQSKSAKIEQFAKNARHTDWAVRRDAIAALAVELKDYTPYPFSTLTAPLIRALHDKDWHVRSVALAVLVDNFERTLRTAGNSHASVLSQSEQHRIVHICKRLVADSETTIRRDALRILGKSRSVQVIPALIAALADENQKIQTLATTFLQQRLPTVTRIRFQHPNISISVAKDGELVNPNIADLDMAMPNVRQVEIDLKGADLRKVERFSEYMDAVLGPDYLSKHVTVRLSGDPFRVSELTRSIWSRCSGIESDVAIVVFGSWSPEETTKHTAVSNPDFSTCSFPLTNLRKVFIESTSADFYLLERFLTYAVASLGQRYLNKSVEVFVVGGLSPLHTNIQNALTNLVKKVTEIPGADL